MPKWILKDGKFIPADSHTYGEPTTRGITPGSPPAGIVRSGLMDRIRSENRRRFDKPSEAQIKALEQADNEALAKQQDCAPIVRETKRDLESGKIRVSSDVLAGLNGKKYNKVVPFGSIKDERGVTHVIPADRVPNKLLPSYTSPEELYGRMKEEFEKNKTEIVSASMGKIEPGNLPAVSEASVIEGSLQKVKGNRDLYRGRTIT